MKALHLLLAALLLPALLPAQSEVVERNAAQPETQVEVRTYTENGKTVTERVTTTRAVEREVRTPVSTTRKAAIFVTDSSTNDLGGSTMALQDAIAAVLTNAGFSIISQDINIGSLTSLRGGGDTSLDKALNDNSTALRLAQDLNTDYIVFASFLGLGQEKRRVTTYGMDYENITSNLRVAYRILDASEGGSLVGDTITVSKSFRQSENAGTTSDDVLNSLIVEAADKVTQNVVRRTTAKPLAPAVVNADRVNVSIEVEAADLEFPEFDVTPEKQVVLTGRKLKLTPTSVTVEVNGVAVGTAPGKFQLRPGLNKIRLTRDGFKDWEKTVNFFEGQKFSVAMEMDQAGYERWLTTTKFIQDLKDQSKLNDAEAESIRGLAQFLRQSKIELKELNITNKSLF